MNRYLPVQVIRADESYTIEEFRRRTGIGDYKWRRLRKVLPCRVDGKKIWILGADWLKHLESIEPN